MDRVLPRGLAPHARSGVTLVAPPGSLDAPMRRLLGVRLFRRAALRSRAAIRAQGGAKSWPGAPHIERASEANCRRWFPPTGELQLNLN